MKKKLLIIGVLALALMGCENKKTDTTPNLALTKQEKEIAKDNANIGAQLLVRNAILNEIKNTKFTDKENYELNYVKEDAAIAYFLQKKILTKIDIPDSEVNAIYNQNKDKLKKVSEEQAKAQIKAVLIKQAENHKISEYYNSLVEKYKLNDLLKKEFPPKDKKTEKTTESK